MSIIVDSNLEHLDFADRFFQTRTAIHLYDALRQRNLIRPIQNLDIIDGVCSTDLCGRPSGKRSEDFLGSFLRARCHNPISARSCVDHLRTEYTKTKKEAQTRSETSSCTGLSHQTVVDLVLLLNHFLRGYRFRTSQAEMLSPIVKLLFSREFPQPEDHDDVANLCLFDGKLLQDGIAVERDILRIHWLKVGDLLDRLFVELYESLGFTELIRECQRDLPSLRDATSSQSMRKAKALTLTGIVTPKKCFLLLQCLPNFSSKKMTAIVTTVRRSHIS